MPVLLVALAVALRLGWVLLVPTRPVGDFALYVESAAHLLAHHAFDSEFIYMPGYVFLLAGVQALGGGLLAAKLVGVACGGLAAGAVFGIAQSLFGEPARGRRAAVVATLLYACWPAGIAVCSVTGTDLPAAALLAAAVWVLVGSDRGRPWRASILFGLVLGLAAYVRAVALPLALLALPYWLATRVRPRVALARTAVGCAVAFLLLLPWGIRNQRRYGEFFLTDSHGGHTALVGSNPNSEGVYSRSLNQMFWKGTGYRLFDPAPRDSDRAAYALAKSWAAFEPAYAVGLVAAKADRLLTNERGLLYWPLYRPSVLRDPPLGWFARHRAGIERLVDGFWYLLAAAALIGLVVAALRRNLRALGVTLFPLALVALYATFFSEVRYHLAIAVFMFPFAGLAACWLAESARGAAAGAFKRRELLAAALVVAALFFGWPRLVRAGAGLRDRHRWAVCVCDVAGRSRLCSWRAVIPAPGEGLSPLRGVWDGVGLRVTGVTAAARSRVELPGGRYRISARALVVAPADSATGELRIDLRAGANGSSPSALIAGAGLSPSPGNAAVPTLLSGTVEHAGGALEIDLDVERTTPGAAGAPPTVWLDDINIEPDPG